MTDTHVVERRWSEKLIGGMAAIIGALILIVWTIVWRDVSDHGVRLNALESDKKVFDERMKNMDLKLDKMDLKLDRIQDKK